MSQEEHPEIEKTRLSIIFMRYLGIACAVSLAFSLQHYPLSFPLIGIAILAGIFWSSFFILSWKYNSMLFVHVAMFIPVLTAGYCKELILQNNNLVFMWVWWSILFTVVGVILWAFKKPIDRLSSLPSIT